MKSAKKCILLGCASLSIFATPVLAQGHAVGAVGDVALGEALCQVVKEDSEVAKYVALGTKKNLKQHFKNKLKVPNVGLPDVKLPDVDVPNPLKLINGNVSPYCDMNDPVTVLLFTASLIDQTALSAAEAVDSVQQALGIKRTLLTDIQTLRQLTGENASPLDTISDERDAMVARTGEAGKAAAEEIAKIALTGGVTPELRALADDAAKKLGETLWLTIQANVGVKKVFGVVKANFDEGLLQHEQVGLTSEFFQLFPDRAQKQLRNNGAILVGYEALRKVNDKDFQKTLRKSDQKGQNAAKKISKKKAKEATNVGKSLSI